MNSDLISYYKQRANEYERIYSKPERQADLLNVSELLKNIFSGKEVLEIACGTGYWTEKISTTARHIFATDINESVIEVAKSKNYISAIDFKSADIFEIPANIKYESLFGGFIWSHIKLEELNSFIDIVNNLVQKNGTIVFIDNNYIEGSSLPITETDHNGNTYQKRSLEDGTVHKVLKNFSSGELIRQSLKEKAADIHFINLKHYWVLKYTNI